MKKLTISLILSALTCFAHAQTAYTYGASSIRENITATAQQSNIGAAQSVVITNSTTKVVNSSTINPTIGVISNIDSVYNQMMYSIGTNTDSNSSASSFGTIKTIAKSGISINDPVYAGLNAVVDGGLNGSAEGIRYNSSSVMGNGGSFVISKTGIGTMQLVNTKPGLSTITTTNASTLVKSTPLSVDSVLLKPFVFSGKAEINVNLQSDTSAQ
jgi:hypothetical protein